MTEDLGGSELATGARASLFEVEHCGILWPCGLCVAWSHTELPPWGPECPWRTPEWWYRTLYSDMTEVAAVSLLAWARTSPAKPLRGSYKDLAAHSARLWPDVEHQSDLSGQALRKLMWNAVDLRRVHWYFNNQRNRHKQAASMTALMSCGTSAIEAFHKEINDCFTTSVIMFSCE